MTVEINLRGDGEAEIRMVQPGQETAVGAVQGSTKIFTRQNTRINQAQPT